MITTIPQRVEGTETTVRRYNELTERRKELDRQSRKLKKEISTLETAIGDAVDANDGLLEAGRYLVEWTESPGRTSYKSICEKHISPGLLLSEIESTPKRRKLIIISE